MATIYDVAKTCGLSPGIVSKALSGARGGSDATRARVRIAADSLGYIPGGNAWALSRNTSRTICVLCQDDSEMGLRHYLFAQIIESFKSVMDRHGYDIMFISGRMGKMGLSYYGHCCYRKADGVFIVCADHASKDMRELLDSAIPKTAIDYTDGSVSCVMTDSDKGMDLLYGYLYGLGHRNFVYLHGEPTKYITDLRINSLGKAMALRGETLKPDNLVPSSYYSLSGGYESMRRVLARASRPTAIIASDDYNAIGAIRAAVEAGLRVPEDISVAGFDGIEIAQVMSPRLTTIRQDTVGMGSKAAENLIKQILGIGKGSKPETIILEPQLLAGGSCGRIL